jgi:hypothetical protein
VHLMRRLVPARLLGTTGYSDWTETYLVILRTVSQDLEILSSGYLHAVLSGTMSESYLARLNILPTRENQSVEATK